MVDEKEEHYEEEGEYHFSDDQVNYDVEPEAAAATKPVSTFTKDAFLAKFTQNRRKILGVVSLVILIGVVYKILMPAAAPPSTDFNPAPTAAKTAKPMAAPGEKSTAVSQPASTPVSPPTAAASPTVENKPVSSPMPAVENKPAPSTAMQNQPPASPAAMTPPPTASATVTSPIPPVPQSLPATAPMPPITQSTVQPPGVANQTTPTVVTPPPMLDGQAKDRITALEQQNTAMMNLLQTEYAQKIADTETQANAVRGKMEELTKRVNRMEASLDQITQLLQGMSKSQASGVMGGAPPSIYNVGARPAEPRMIYSVQAIIPGRAWLKSESGDTVTVAEGDYLKKYGRVTKIDPYDGIVAIDTGNKIITLSYGVDGE